MLCCKRIFDFIKGNLGEIQDKHHQNVQKTHFLEKVPGVNGLKIPKVRTETARKSSYFNGSRLFNDIPNELEDINSVMIFKARILEFYESQAS